MVVVFTHHNEVLSEVSALLKANGFKVYEVARNVAPQQHMSFTGRATYGNAGPGQWQWHPPSCM